MIELTVIIFLLCFIVFLEVKSFYERRELTNKIMAKNYDQYSLHELNHQSLKKPNPHRTDEELMTL